MSSTRRARIEEEALRLFAEKGIASVSIREIAQAVGIGESGIYRHTTSKEALALEVFGKAYGAFSQDLRQALAPHGDDFPAAVRAIADTIYAAFDADPVLLRFLVLRQHDTMAQLDLGEDNPVAVVYEVVAQAHARGCVGVDPDVALAFLMGVVLQPMTNSLYGRLEGPVSRLAPVVAAAALRALDFHEGGVA